MTNLLSSNVTYTAIGAGLDAWVGLAKSIRLSTRGGLNHPPFVSGGGIIDTSQATTYYMGAGILIGILIITMVFTLLGSLCQCFALCCCLKKIRRKRKTVATSYQKACSVAWLLFIYVFFLVGALTSFTGGNALATAILSFQGTIVGTLNSTLITVGNLSPAIGTTFTNLNTVVGTAIDTTINSVNLNALYDLGVVSNMQNLSTSMRTTNTNKLALIASGAAFKSNMTVANSSLTTIVDNIKLATAAVASWSAPAGVAITGGSWRLADPVIAVGSTDALADACQTNFANCPDGAAQLAPLSTMPNLATFANEIDSLLNKLTVDVRATILSSGTNTKSSVGTSLVTARNSITSSLNTMKTDLDKTINPMITDVNSMFEMVKGFEGYRSIAMITLSSLIILILVVFSVLFYFKKPAGIKGCNLAASPLYILIQLLAIILCILAIVFGDVCSSVFEYSPPPITRGLDKNMGDMITKAFNAKDRCAANVSIITIATDLGFISASSVNVTRLASEQIDTVDFSGLTNSFNLNSTLSLSNSPTSQLNNLVTLNTSALVGTNFDVLGNGLTNVITALNALRASNAAARSGSRNITLGGSVTIPQGDADFLARSTALEASIDSIITSINTFNTTTIPNLKNSIDNLRITAESLKSSAAPIPNSYTAAMSAIGTFSTNASANLTNVIPSVKTYIKNQIAVEEVSLLQRLNCVQLGASLVDVQDAVCGRLLGGLDALWLSYAVLGFVAALSMPSLIYAVNRLLAYTFRIDPEAPIIDKGYQPIKNKSSGPAKKNVKKTHPEDDEDPLGGRNIQITIR